MGQRREAAAVRVGQAQAATAKLVFQHTIFGHEIGDHLLLVPLQPATRSHQLLFRVVSSLLVLGLTLAWNAMRRPALSGEGTPVQLRVAALGAAALVAVLLQAPYKLTTYNEVPVAIVGGLRCYIVGERGADVRSYCPGWDLPRVRTVSSRETAIEPCGFEENIFSASGGTSCKTPP